MIQLVVNENLTLRQLTAGDAQASLNLVEKNRRHLGTWLPWVESLLTIEDELEYISQAAAAIANGQKLEMGIFMSETSDTSTSKKSEAWKMVGTCGIVNIDRKHAEPFAELGYWLDQELTGRGIVTQACKKVIEHAFTTLNVAKVKIVSHQDNSSSISVAKRLHFQPTAEKVTEPNKYHKDPNEMIVFALHKHDWENANSGQASLQ